MDPGALGQGVVMVVGFYENFFELTRHEHTENTSIQFSSSKNWEELSISNLAWVI